MNITTTETTTDRWFSNGTGWNVSADGKQIGLLTHRWGWCFEPTQGERRWLQAGSLQEAREAIAEGLS